MSADEVEMVDEVEGEIETNGKGRGRRSKYPPEVAASAQKVYRKVYNRQFKANKALLKAGKDVELEAKQAALEAKNAYLVEAGFDAE